MPGEVNILLAVPSTLGAALLFSALLFQLCFLIYRIDTGPVARLQQYSTWSAAIAVIGHVVNAYRFDNHRSATNISFAFSHSHSIIPPLLITPDFTPKRMQIPVAGV
jgi:hypothetical protein